MLRGVRICPDVIRTCLGVECYASPWWYIYIESLMKHNFNNLAAKCNVMPQLTNTMCRLWPLAHWLGQR
jgi:hypothetical protein